MTDRASVSGLLGRHPRLLVTADFSAEGVEALRALGPVRLLGWAAGAWFADAEELRAAAQAADVIVVGYEPVTADLLDAAPGVRLIASIRSDPRANVDVEAATARGIPVLHTVGRTDRGVAEFTLATMLALVRNLVPAVAWMRHRPTDFVPSAPFYRGTVWGEAGHAPQLRFAGIELAGRTLGLIGLGSIGRAVVRLASGFSMRLVAHDPYVSPAAVAGLGVELVSLRQMLAEADVVTLHARLTPSSRGLLGAAEFGLMKPGAYLVNTARAGLVDRVALLDALATGRLAGAALDVFDQEPPAPDDPLVDDPRVLPTPHLAAWTRELTEHHSRSLVDELARIAAGQAPRQVANPEVFASPSGDGAIGSAGRHGQDRQESHPEGKAS